MPEESRLDLLASLLRAFFADYLRLLEPEAAEHLCLDRITFLALPDRQAVAAEVPDLRGEVVTVLVRIEPGPPDAEEVSQLLSRWLGALGIVYSRPVLFHLIYMSGGRPGLNLETAAVTRVTGMETLRIFYLQFGLSEARAEHYLDRPEPLAWALAAWMRPAHLAPESLREACRRRIRAAELPEELQSLLLRVVEGGPAGAGASR
jgi:hypothetical protein